MKKILLIEDDFNVINFIRKGLEEEGYEVSVALNGSMGFSMVKNNPFDLIILDIMLPDRNGLDVCGEIRSTGIQVPVLFLTALSTAENVAHGLDSGGDDYLIKPFKFIELLARIKALLRRADQFSDNRYSGAQQDTYVIGDLRIDDKAKTVV